MLFNTYTFLIFFAGVFGLYCVLEHRWQNLFLLVASYVFYGWWDYRFLGLLALSTLVDFVAGQRITASKTPKGRRLWLILSLSANLGMLGFFKYFNFFVDSAATLLASIGLPTSIYALQIILPVGISFYTFQTLSYTIDIYRGGLKPARSFLEFALFVSFFPQLVAGPIERAADLIPQIEQPRRMSWDGWCEGTTLIIIGLFKKIAIADTMAPMADMAFNHPQSCSTITLLIGLYLFSIQIYADFSGYSDMARGLAQIMGFHLTENFQQPYFSASITEFWRRWHISLSSWLRDYLYIPLGGNRLGPRRASLNLFLTMLLGGLWHGASWTFVAWGFLHGSYLALHKLILRGQKPPTVPPKDNIWRCISYAARTALTFHLVALTWIFFRAENFQVAWEYLSGICSFRSNHDIATGMFRFDADEWSLALWSMVGLLLLVDVPQYAGRSHVAMLRWALPLKAGAFFVLVVWIIMSRRAEYVPFIYFQF